MAFMPSLSPGIMGLGLLLYENPRNLLIGWFLTSVKSLLPSISEPYF